jgi:hypothetical protein
MIGGRRIFTGSGWTLLSSTATLSSSGDALTVTMTFTLTPS